jgi:hypothetical protein
MKSAAIGTGWLAVVFLVANVLSGLWLWLHYVPEAALAYDSIVDFENALYAGAYIRGIHYFSSHLFIAAVLAHAAGSIMGGTDFATLAPGKWPSGVVLGAGLVALAFLGKVLPFDQHGGVSLVVVKNFAGLGSGPTLTSILWLHIAGALLLLPLMAVHVGPWLRGPSSGAVPGSRAAKVLFGVAGALAILVVPLAARAPLGPAYDERLASAGVVAQWHLRWLQWLTETSPTAARIALPALLLLALLTPRLRAAAGDRGMRIAWAAVAAVLVVMSVLRIG